jgi:hypothetical protein
MTSGTTGAYMPSTMNFYVEFSSLINMDGCSGHVDFARESFTGMLIGTGHTIFNTICPFLTWLISILSTADAVP